ncbi:NB-ARC domain-containing protein [Spirillospora sp. NPDC048911]|uniref:NB-ARC domain-containing protein n=1 Tax=Spirillospora sp. NPDC048911 TaxID=3364527 RepID=UPI0037219C53
MKVHKTLVAASTVLAVSLTLYIAQAIASDTTSSNWTLLVSLAVSLVAPALLVLVVLRIVVVVVRRRSPASGLLPTHEQPVPRAAASDLTFRGRERELRLLLDRHEEQRRALAQPEAGARPRRVPAKILIYGPPGVGKSELGRVLARRLAPHYDTVISVPMGEVGLPVEPGKLLGTMLDKLGYQSSLQTDPGERRNMFRSVTDGKSVLFVFDGARDADQIRAVMPSEPRCGVIVTSRFNLGSALEAKPLWLDVPDEAEAAEIIRAYLPAAERGHFDEVAEVAALCERLPMALRSAAELAAEKEGGLREVKRHLDKPSKRIERLARHGNIGERIQTAYDTSLTPPAQQALQMLALLETPTFVPWALQSLLDITPQQANELIIELADTSLVDALSAREPLSPQPDQSGFPRFRLSPLVRVFLSSHPDFLGEEEQRAALGRLYSASVVGVERVLRALGEITSPPAASTVQEYWLPSPTGWEHKVAANAEHWVRLELNLLVEVVLTAHEQGQDEVCWRLASWFCDRVTAEVNHKRMALAFSAALVSAERSGDTLAVIRVRRSYGAFLLVAEQYLAAFDQLYTAASLAEAAAMPLEQARLCHEAGHAWQRLGCQGNARDDVRFAELALARQNDERLAHRVRLLSAEIQARSELEQWHVTGPGPGNDQPRFQELIVLADACVRRGSWPEADMYLAQAEQECAEEPARSAYLYSRYVALLLRKKDAEPGSGSLLTPEEPALDIAADGAGQIPHAEEDGTAGQDLVAAAVRYGERAVAAARRFGGIGEIRARVVFAEALLASGDTATCEVQLNKATTVADCQPVRFVQVQQAELNRVRGMLDLQSGRPQVAIDRLERALQAFIQQGDAWCQARTRLFLGEAYLSQAQRDKGLARLYCALESFNACKDEPNARRARKLIEES